MGASVGQQRLRKGRVSSYGDLTLSFTCLYFCSRGPTWAGANALQAVQINSKPEELLASMCCSIPFTINTRRRQEGITEPSALGLRCLAPRRKGSRRATAMEHNSSRYTDPTGELRQRQTFCSAKNPLLYHCHL